MFFPKIEQFFIGLVQFFTLRKSFVNFLFDYIAYDNLELFKYSHHVQIMEEMAAPIGARVLIEIVSLGYHFC